MMLTIPEGPEVGASPSSMACTATGSYTWSPVRCPPASRPAPYPLGSCEQLLAAGNQRSEQLMLYNGEEYSSMEGAGASSLSYIETTFDGDDVRYVSLPRTASSRRGRQEVTMETSHLSGTWPRRSTDRRHGGGYLWYASKWIV